MKPPLLHVLGGGPWQVPTVRLAKSMGYRVLVTDYYRERPASALADHHELVDITDLDATLAVAIRYRIDGILCDTTDVGVPAAAYVAEQLGLPGMGFEVALNCTNKGRMRQAVKRAGLKVPAFYLLKSEDELTRSSPEMPVMVKPVDSQSSKGVTMVRKHHDLARAFRHALQYSREGTVLIEDVVRGAEIIVDGFVLDGETQILGIARKTPHAGQPTVSKRITYDNRLDGVTRARIERVNRQVLGALGLKSGVFHAEYMLDDQDVIPLDVAARGGGCMIYTHVLPFISGVNANLAMIALAMGQWPSIRVSRNRSANIEFLDLPKGVLAAVEGHEQVAALPGVLGLHFNVSAGDRIVPLRKKDERPGYVVTGHEHAERAIAAAGAAKACVRVRMQGSRCATTID